MESGKLCRIISQSSHSQLRGPPCSSSPSTASRSGSISLPGVRVQVPSVTVAAILVARSAAADVLRAGGEDAEIKAGLAFTRSLAHSGIAGWEGIGDAERQSGRADQGDDRRRARPVAGVRRHRSALRRAGDCPGRGKKRLIALAEWHFGGGEGYCAACPEACQTCPYREHAMRQRLTASPPGRSSCARPGRSAPLWAVSTRSTSPRC